MHFAFTKKKLHPISHFRAIPIPVLSFPLSTSLVLVLVPLLAPLCPAMVIDIFRNDSGQFTDVIGLLFP